MTDCVLFATLFITYAVLHNNTFGGPSSRGLFDLSTSFAETMILLFSSVACGFSVLHSLKNEKNKVIIWLAVAFLLGASFIAIELLVVEPILPNTEKIQNDRLEPSAFSQMKEPLSPVASDVVNDLHVEPNSTKLKRCKMID